MQSIGFEAVKHNEATWAGWHEMYIYRAYGQVFLAGFEACKFKCLVDPCAACV